MRPQIHIPAAVPKKRHNRPHLLDRILPWIKGAHLKAIDRGQLCLLFTDHGCLVKSDVQTTRLYDENQSDLDQHVIMWFDRHAQDLEAYFKAYHTIEIKMGIRANRIESIRIYASIKLSPHQFILQAIEEKSVV